MLLQMRWSGTTDFSRRKPHEYPSLNRSPRTCLPLTSSYCPITIIQEYMASSSFPSSLSSWPPCSLYTLGATVSLNFGSRPLAPLPSLSRITQTDGRELVCFWTSSGCVDSQVPRSHGNLISDLREVQALNIRIR